MLAMIGVAPIASYAGTYTFQNTSSSLENMAHGTAYTWGLTTTVAHSTGTNLAALEAAVATGHQTITSATVTISNIYDWEANNLDPADVLYVNLLNGVSTGVHDYEYNSSPATGDTSFGTDPLETGSIPTVSNHPLTHYLTFDPVSSTPAPSLYDQSNSLLKYTGSDNVTSYNHQTNPGTWSDPNGGHATGFNLVVTLSTANISLLDNLLVADNNTATDLGLGFGPDCHYYDSGVTFTITTGPAVVGVPDSGITLVMLGTVLLGLAGFARRSKRPSVA
jgi:hypothetical protein